MKRDGATLSLWQDSTADYTPQSEASGKDIFDVVIVGGGITGVTTALLLQQAGKRCLVAEAHTLCYGTSGGTTAHLNTFLDTDYYTIEKDFGEEAARLVSRATHASLGLYRKHVSELNIDCAFSDRDGYLYAQDEQQEKELDDIFQASKRAGVEVAYADTTPVPIPFTKAMVYRGQAQLHPTRYVQALAQAFEAAGGVILQNCQVTAQDQQGEEIVLTSSRGELRGRHLIYATHIPPGINLLHFRCAPYRSYVLALKLKNEVYPEALAYDMYDPYHYYRTQEVDGQRYLIAGGEDHKTGHLEHTESAFQQLEAEVRKHFDIEAVTHRWSSQYFEPSDGLAYIGHLPGNPDNVWVASGFGGNGMTYSHIAALTLRDLIVNGQSEFGELFRPGRVKPAAGFTAFVQENADVVKEFFGRRLSQQKISGLSELAAGEARVVKYDGKSVAIYKDDNGKVHAVNPVCPHAKCIVAWNSAEKSWDCPCHGARYAPSGELLTGPARHGLEPVDLDE